MGNSREYIVPGRTVRISTAITHFGEVEGFQDRCAAVVAILDKLFPAANRISFSFGLDVVARELALVWDDPSRLPTNGPVVAKVTKIQALARSLLDDQSDKLAPSGISPEMICSIIGAAHADVFTQQVLPRKGRFPKKGALRLAQRFAYYYPLLTGRPAGVNSDHDFVVTLDLLFIALSIPANAQHFAKLALEKPEIDNVGVVG